MGVRKITFRFELVLDAKVVNVAQVITFTKRMHIVKVVHVVTIPKVVHVANFATVAQSNIWKFRRATRVMHKI